MPQRTASARWDGTLEEGHGTMRMKSGSFEGPYSFQSRFQEGDGTNPEELIAAAHAGCFSMALSADLSRAGHDATTVETTATVHLELEDSGPRIARIVLDTRATVPGHLGRGVPAGRGRHEGQLPGVEGAGGGRDDRSERRARRVSSASDPARAAAAAAAVELVEPDMTIGLGSGRAVWKVVELLASSAARRCGP